MELEKKRLLDELRLLKENPPSTAASSKREFMFGRGRDGRATPGAEAIQKMIRDRLDLHLRGHKVTGAQTCALQIPREVVGPGDSFRSPQSLGTFGPRASKKVARVFPFLLLESN